MSKMIVGINYTQDGSRTIDKLTFNAELSETALSNYAKVVSESCDETYIVYFDPNSQDFINAIVTNGCRI